MSSLIINESPLLVLPTLANRIGLHEAIVLQQVHYWLGQNPNQNFFKEHPWVHNTYEQWQKQFSFWSVRTIQRIFQTLEDSKLLVSVSKYERFHKTKYYRVNYERLSHMQKQSPSLQRKPISFAPNLPIAEERGDLEKDLRIQENPEFSSSSTFGTTDEPDLACYSEDLPDQHTNFVRSHREKLALANEMLLDICERSPGNPEFPPTSISGTSDQPDLACWSEKTSDFLGANTRFGTLHHAKSGCLYNTYTENTDRERREEREERKKEKNKKEKDFEKNLENQRPSPEGKVCEHSSIQHMLDTWNLLVQEPLYGENTKIQLTEENARTLATLLAEGFKNSSIDWEAFCKKISQNRLFDGKRSWGSSGDL